MDLSNLNFIPQAYTLKGKVASLESLVNGNSVKEKPKKALKCDVLRNGDNFTFSKEVLTFDKESGYTAAISETNELFLIKSSLTEKGYLKAHFLKGANPSGKVTGPFLSLLFETVFPNNTEFYFKEVEKDKVWEVVLTKPVIVETIVESPISEINTLSESEPNTELIVDNTILTPMTFGEEKETETAINLLDLISQ